MKKLEEEKKMREDQKRIEDEFFRHMSNPFNNID